MSYCLNPLCQKPRNPKTAEVCRQCGAKLLLKDRYRPLQLIGQGGFGRTFLAIDQDKPSKPRCVIKQFFPEAQAIAQVQKARALFDQEATRLEELGHHCQIPELLAYFNQEQHQYLVQEYIDGQNLAQLLAEQGAFSEAQIRQILQNLLPVLEFIHSHKVIHRDIKPANIIRRTVTIAKLPASQLFATIEPPEQLTSDWPCDLVLVDFGAAKSATMTALAKTGTTIGSPEYIAPEQSRGKAVFASDLYSLGLTCVHLLTKVSPFDLYDLKEDAWVWREYLEHPVGEALGKLLDRLIEGATSRRYQLASQVLADLQSVAPVQPSLPVAAERSSPIAAQSPDHQPTVARKLRSRSPAKITHWYCAQTLVSHPGKVFAVAFSSIAPAPDVNHILLSSGAAAIKVWDADSGQQIGRLTGHVDVVYALAVSPDSRVLASGSFDKTVKLWDLQTGLRLSSFSGHSDTVLAIAFSPDGKTLASGSLYDPIRLWDWQSGQEKGQFSGHLGRIEALAFSPNGDLLASGSGDMTIRIWHVATGQLAQTLIGHSQLVSTVIFSADGKTLISSSWDGSIKFWNLQTGKEKRTLRGDASRIGKLALSPDGKTLVSGGDMLQVWQIRPGQETVSLPGHSQLISAITFAPDGKTFVSSSWDGTIKLWRSQI